MHYRLIFSLLFIFILIAYIDTKSLKQYFAEAKILKEYESSSKLIGLGLKDKNGKIAVNDVILNTPADAAGVEIGDVILDIDGKKMKSADMVKNYLNSIKNNKKILLTLKKADNSIVRINGEWFSPTQDILDYINENNLDDNIYVDIIDGKVVGLFRLRGV